MGSETLDFSKLSSVELVALHLQCSPDDFRNITENPNSYYAARQVPKGRKKLVRVIHVGTPLIRRIHRTIALALRPALNALPKYVCGFRPKYSTKDHAAGHCNRPVVVTADLKDFFLHVSTRMIQHVFESEGVPQQMALLLARICSVDGRLPQGGRASPALANLAVRGLDAAMVAFAARHGLNFSRYADDFAFSGETAPPADELAKLIASSGFELRSDSYRVQSKNTGQFVTGLSVIGKEPQIPRAVRRSLEKAIFFVKKYGWERHLSAIGTPHISPQTYRRRLEGIAVSYAPVEPKTSAKWLSELSGLATEIPECENN